MTNPERRWLEAIGDRVRERRTDLGMTQAELADRCGLHRTFIGMVERGERNLAILNLRAIARGLGVGVRDLIPEEGRK